MTDTRLSMLQGKILVYPAYNEGRLTRELRLLGHSGSFVECQLRSIEHA